MKTSFYISTTLSGRSRKIRVDVYDTHKEMLRGIEAYQKRNQMDEEPAGFDTVAMTHSFEGQELKDDRWQSMPLVNVIHLHKARLGSEVVIHEASHAALHIYSLDMVAAGDSAEQHINPGNENFCYLMGRIARLIIKGLYEKGIYQ